MTHRVFAERQIGKTTGNWEVLPMRIVRPYGQSVTSDPPSGQARQRLLQLRDSSQTVREIVPFAERDDALVIAQWISAIDKIATKPRGNGRPTADQRQLRTRLGEAAWSLIVDNGLLSGLENDTDQHLEKLWRFKIHPYQDGVAAPRKDKKGNTKEEPSPKGRWYARFAGEVAPEAIDANEVASRIFEHLHVAEYRLVDTSPKKQCGRIVGRAESIAGNVLRQDARRPTSATWSEDDRAAYEEKVGNIAQAIHEAAITREAESRRVGPDIAAAVLHRAWADLFDGEPPTFKEARDRCPALVELHEAIRDRYRRTLKRHKKDRREHGDRRRKVSAVLPRTMEELFKLVDRTLANRDVGRLVRLGKVIHYEAAARAGASAGGDAPAHVLTRWPSDVTQSRFWSSEGQAEIKRNEAFVRVWRHGIVLASQTLRDWGDPEGRYGDDILLKNGKEKLSGLKDGEEEASDSLLDPGQHARKLRVLLGTRAGLFLDGRDENFQRRTLRLALDGTAQYRHNAFHFNGLGSFVQALKASKVEAADDLRAALERLWTADLRGRAERLRETMRAAHLDRFFGKERVSRLFEAVSGAMELESAVDLPLPRFRRLLRRAAGIGGENGIELRLPEPRNRDEMEAAPPLRAQYVGLKLLYEHPFREWLAHLPRRRLKQFIDKAVGRSEREAKRLFGGKDQDREAFVMAKAHDLARLGEAEQLHDFLRRLTAETASEMRVQRGYESDKERARKQAGFIENLRCDVLAQAFDRFLGNQGFLFLTRIQDKKAKLPEPLFDLGELDAPQIDTSVEHWQALLYFILHLVPVDDAARLLHQVRKWDLLAGKAAGKRSSDDPDVRRVVRALSLYLDMHDAKFAGPSKLEVLKPFEQLYGSKRSFDRVFPLASAAGDDERLPLRGLREIMRFGHLPALMPIFEAHRVSDDEVEAVLAAEQGAIAAQHAQREELHEQWARERKTFSGQDCRIYVEAVAAVSWHRLSAAHVRLVDHVRLHRLMMAMLGRLVDFSGLWERDLYFALLALLHERGLEPNQALNKQGRRSLGSGQIIAARRGLKENEIDAALLPYFGTTSDKQEPVSIRNSLAHFDLVKSSAAEAGRLDLTAAVNAARRLMTHDRKLKNAVAQSVIELLGREGLILSWDVRRSDGVHALADARVAPRTASHLGGVRLYEKTVRGKRAPYNQIAERLHGDRFVAMVARLFAGTAADTRSDVHTIRLDRIDWQKVDKHFKGSLQKPSQHRRHKHPGKPPRRRPEKQRSNAD